MPKTNNKMKKQIKCNKCKCVLNTNCYITISGKSRCKNCSLDEIHYEMKEFTKSRIELIECIKTEPCFEKSGKPVILSLKKSIKCIEYILINKDDKLDETLKFINMISVRAEEHLFDEKHMERLYMGIVDGLLNQINIIKKFNKDYKFIQSCE